LALEVAQEKKERAKAARRQKELNKRTQALAERTREEEGYNNPRGGGGNGNGGEMWQSAASFDASAFPDLANPLGFASGAPGFSPSSGPTASGGGGGAGSGTESGGTAGVSPATGSPELRGRVGSQGSSSPATRVANWNLVAEKGMASSELWVPLGASAGAASPPVGSSSHWGAAAAPMSSRPATGAGGSNPPALHLGSASWGARKPQASSSAASGSKAEEAELPPPSVNRHGQTTLFSTAGRRSYR